jgi:serine protease Do
MYQALQKYLTLGFILFLGSYVLQAQARAGLPDFTELSKDNSPAVVNISTKQIREESGRRNFRGFELPDLPDNSPFNEFFRHFFEEGIPGIPEEREGQSLGSGFIISEDGYILTNHHVVNGADEIEVRLNDRRNFAARIIGSDKASDVALIKIDADDLPIVNIGKSSQLEVGEWVLAIGSPFGFDYSVTAGIVSAKGRSLPRENYVPFIQTDVAINPGNSGGPLFNLDGEVVGINSQIYSRTGGFMGLSFAIPIELAMNVAKQLRETGSVARGYLGVLIQNVDRSLAESFGLEQPTGALISRVLPDAPAAEAGLKVGDIILSFNGNKIHNSSTLPPIVGTSPIGEEARVEVMRNGKRLDMKVRIAELPGESDNQPKVIPSEQAAPQEVHILGMRVMDLTARARQSSKLKTGGALVASVNQGAAQRAGIQRDDVIQMYDGKTVDSAKDLATKVKASEKDGLRSVAVLILRDGEPMFVALRLKQAE